VPFKRNIWSIFNILIGVGFIVVIILSYLRWENLKSATRLQHENITKIISNSNHAFFMQQEMILDILGSQLIEANTYQDHTKTLALFSKLTKLYPFFAGFGLADSMGNLKVISNNMDPSLLPNLLEQSESQESFKQTLKSDVMVIGHTYFFKPLNQWVIPIRKAIRDANGSVVAVMNAGIKLNTKKGFFNGDMLIDDEHIINFVRSDYRIQYVISHNKAFSLQEFNAKITPQYIAQFIDTLEQKTHYTLKELEQKEKIASFFNIRYMDNKEVITAVRFDTRYQLWTISQSSIDHLRAVWWQSLFIFGSIFVAGSIILFFLFRYIAQIEKSRHDALKYQAMHDPLTTLPNRNYLLHETHSWFKHKRFSLMFVDLDHFKYINDTFGHNTGDEVLKEVAKRLKKVTKTKDFVLRQGGDEFVVFSRSYEREKLETYARKIIDSITKPYRIEHSHFLIGASIGIARYPKDSDELDGLLKYADMALYEAKKTKNTVCIFEETMQQSLMQKIEIEHHLKIALLDDEFSLHYQPQILQDGGLYGVEALIRWKNPILGHITPEKFIPIAEASGFMPYLGEFIIQKSLQETQALHERLGRHYQISINVSLKQFLKENFTEFLLAKINEVGIDPHCITLEMTEGLFIEDMEYIVKVLRKIKSHGIKVSIDDFGTGYSSLALLKDIPFDELKIDKAFVRDIIEDQSSRDMVKSIIGIGKSFGAHIVAEGIEQKEQVEVLKALECDIFQGYFCAKPMNLEEFATFVQQR